MVLVLLITCALVIVAAYWVARLTVGIIADLLPRSENWFTYTLRVLAAIALFAAVWVTSWCLFHGRAGIGVGIGGILLLLLSARR